MLDHAIATLLPLTKALKAKNQNTDKDIVSEFVVRDKFSPAQKNEKQLHFSKLNSAGRKKSKHPLKLASQF